MSTTTLLPPAPEHAYDTQPDRVRPTIISARGLSRTFRARTGDVQAVSGLTLDVAEGELVAFLGPNGAGKSTSLRMLTTLLAPTAGSAIVCGHDVARAPGRVRAEIGYVGQGNGAANAQLVRDELLVQGKAFGLSRAAREARADELLEAFDLVDLAGRKASTLSGGQRRRLDVAIGIVHRPRLLFLDEPSTGLDPQSRANLWEHILRLRAKTGMTIFLTTHYLDEADQFAERVLVMDYGQVIADDTAAALKAELAGDRIIIGSAEPAMVCHVGGDLLDVDDPEVDGAFVTLRVADAPGALPSLLRALDAASVDVFSAEVRRPTLDDVFLALTGRSLREEAA